MRGRAQRQPARPTARRTHYTVRRPAKTPLNSDGLVAFAACATLSATTAFHSVNTAGVFGMHSVFCSW